MAATVYQRDNLLLNSIWDFQVDTLWGLGHHYNLNRGRAYFVVRTFEIFLVFFLGSIKYIKIYKYQILGEAEITPFIV